MPAVPENWMGILDFKEPVEYVFLPCTYVLEEKEAEEQFVLSELTEYVQSQYEGEQIDWTVYRYRRHMIKVMKYCTACGLLNIDDGSEEGFARDYTGEVLYENTGASRYFMKISLRILWDTIHRRTLKRKSGSTSMRTGELCGDREFTGDF